MCNPDVGFVYMMYDNKDGKGAPIYIGKTGSIADRMSQHFASLKNGKMEEADYNSVECIKYAKCNTYLDAGIYERYFVGKLSPRCNTQYANEGEATVKLNTNSLKWVTMTPKRLLDIKGFLAETPTEEEMKNIISDIILIEKKDYSYILHYKSGHTAELFFDKKENGRLYLHSSHRAFYLPEEAKDVFDKASANTPQVVGNVLTTKCSEDAYMETVRKTYGRHNFNFMLSSTKKAIHDRYNELFQENKDGCDMKKLFNPKKDREYANPSIRMQVRDAVNNFILTTT